MTKAAEAAPDHEKSSFETAQQGQPPLQPDGASQHAPCQSSLATTLERKLELELVSDFISTLATAHRCSHMMDERAVHYQQMATRLLSTQRCDYCIALVSTLTEGFLERVPMDGSAHCSRAWFEKLFARIKGMPEFSKEKGEACPSPTSKAGLSIVLPQVNQPVTPPATIGEVTTAASNIDNMKGGFSMEDCIGHVMLEHTSQYVELSRRAEAVLACFDAQAC